MLVTGGSGFAGRHLVRLLREHGDEPAAPTRSELDLTDPAATEGAVRRARPSAVFHLAAQSSVERSWEYPSETLVANVLMTLNLLEAVRSEAPEATVMVASTGEIYGPPEHLPMDESAPLRPQNPYAVSKAGCDLLASQYADAHGMRLVRLRAFNHAGPGQHERFVVGSFTRQVAEAELAGAGEAVLRVGNLDAARDFTDVRDVVRAYAEAPSLEPGTYNVCSGRTVSVRRLIELIARQARIPVRHEVDAERLRPTDVPEVYGTAGRLRAASGWAPQIPLERTLADALAWWRDALS